jgi:hypothetical protein
MLLPLVSGFSPFPPVSVCGTGAHTLGSGFSRQRGILRFGTCFSLPLGLRSYVGGLPSRRPYVLGRTFLRPGRIFLLRPRLPVNAYRQYRNFNLLSIAYAFRPRLRSRLTPGGRTFPGETSGFRRRGFSPRSRYSFRHSHYRFVRMSFRSCFALAVRSPTKSLSQLPRLRYTV